MAGVEGVEPSLSVSKTALQTATTYPNENGRAERYCASYLLLTGSVLFALSPVSLAGLTLNFGTIK